MEAGPGQSALCQTLFHCEVVIVKLANPAVGKVTRASEIYDRRADNRRLARLHKIREGIESVLKQERDSRRKEVRGSVEVSTEALNAAVRIAILAVAFIHDCP